MPFSAVLCAGCAALMSSCMPCCVFRSSVCVLLLCLLPIERSGSRFAVPCCSVLCRSLPVSFLYRPFWSLVFLSSPASSRVAVYVLCVVLHLLLIVIGCKCYTECYYIALGIACTVYPPCVVCPSLLLRSAPCRILCLRLLSASCVNGRFEYSSVYLALPVCL